MIIKYVSTGFFAMYLLFFVGFAVPVQAASLTTEQISAVINLLQSFGADEGAINNVEVALGGSAPSSLSCSSFTNLSYGDFDNNPGGRVSQLQTFLGISSNTFGFGTYGRKTQALWNSLCKEQVKLDKNKTVRLPIISSVNGKGGFGTGVNNYILGRGFSTVKAVYLQSSSGTKTSLSYTLVRDTRLDVAVPTVSGGTYQLYVTNQAGTSAAYSVGYLGAVPLPIISSVNGKGGFGTGVNNYILGQGFSTVIEVYLQSSSGTKTTLTYSVVDDTRLDVVVPTVSGGTYQLYVKNWAGPSAAYSVDF